MNDSKRYDWTTFWNEKAKSQTEFQATGRGSMDIWGFLHTVREISSYLHLERRDDVLDIGCGVGIITMALAPWVRNIHGVDISSTAIDRAMLNCRDIPNMRFSVGDITELDSKIGVYHKVCAYSVLQYLQDSDEVLKAFQCLHSVLKSGGTAFMGANPDSNRYEDYQKAVDQSSMSAEEKAKYVEVIDATLWLSGESMAQLAHKAGLNALVEPINKSIWQHFYMYNLILRKA